VSPFSEYIIFVDESGDPGLARIDPDYPVLVLAFCIFRKEHYVYQTVPALQRFKLRHFGHDQIVLHEREIRRDLGSFSFLKSPALKKTFLEELTRVIGDAEFALVCAVIDKQQLVDTFGTPNDPYHIALCHGLMRVGRYLHQLGQNGKTHVVFERRGKREDDALLTEFEVLRDLLGLPLELVFAGKAANAPGLQFADLIARPVGVRALRPSQDNRAFEAFKSKFLDRDAPGGGLKVYPEKTKGPDAARRGPLPTENPQPVEEI